ncbi:MAG: hypothetical protein Q7R76_05485 [Candidatus Woesearchaeota archaeon]|nr:hypothetical protein [Candidatus Woesearchaeota archaeon]
MGFFRLLKSIFCINHDYILAGTMFSRHSIDFENNPFVQVRTRNKRKIICLRDQLRVKMRKSYVEGDPIKAIEAWKKFRRDGKVPEEGRLKDAIDTYCIKKVTDVYFKNGKYVGVKEFDKHVKTDNLRKGTIIVNLLCTKCSIGMQTFHDLTETKDISYRHPHIEELLIKHGHLKKRN